MMNRFFPFGPMLVLVLTVCSTAVRAETPDAPEARFRMAAQ